MHLLVPAPRRSVGDSSRRMQLLAFKPILMDHYGCKCHLRYVLHHPLVQPVQSCTPLCNWHTPDHVHAPLVLRLQWWLGDQSLQICQ